MQAPRLHERLLILLHVGVIEAGLFGLLLTKLSGHTILLESCGASARFKGFSLRIGKMGNAALAGFRRFLLPLLTDQTRPRERHA
jgi:hypothetical protein